MSLFALAAVLVAPSAMALPSGYAYELVSPVNKHGGEVGVVGRSLGSYGALVSPSGDRVAYSSNNPLIEQVSNGLFSFYVSSSASPTWQTTPLSAAQTGSDFFLAPSNSEERWVSEGLTKALVETEYDPVTGAPLGRAHMFFRDLATGTLRDVSPDSLEGPTNWFDTSFRGSVKQTTPDLSHVLVATEAALTSDAVGVSGLKVYVIDTATGEVVLGSVLGGSPGTPIGLENELVNTIWLGSNRDHVISDSGRYLLFQTGNSSPLYRRDLQDGATVAVNESENTTESLPLGNAEFQDATGDGRYVYFSTAQPLVDADTNTTVDLYRWDADAPAGSRLTLISTDHELADGSGGGGEVNAIHVSEDGRRVYFATLNEQQLVAGGPTAPGVKVYLWEDGTLKYITTDTEENINLRQSYAADPSFSVQRNRFSGTNSSGSLLAFLASTNLIPGEGGEEPCPEEGTKACREVYVYNPTDSTPLEPDLKCISCLPDGAPTLEASFATETNFARTQRFWVAEDGRITFQTRSALLPQDINGDGLDVYTWLNGKLELVSSGISSHDSDYEGQSEDGDVIAFATLDRLTRWDTDERYDMYVAKLGGGLPDPPSEPEGCEADACQPAPVAPNDPTPASASFSGDGNPTAAGHSTRCNKRKGRKAKSKARCVKQKHHAKRKHHADKGRGK
jgi:hypothetical protein